MPSNRPPCPHLPPALLEMSWRNLSAHREERGNEFFKATLCYGQYLWQRGESARALLALMRGLYTDVDETIQVKGTWPLPYAAMLWIMQNHPGDSFIGNPALSFFHQATRGRALQDHRRKARAWAAWRLAEVVFVTEGLSAEERQLTPIDSTIEQLLTQYGLSGEAVLWKSVLSSAKPEPTTTHPIHAS